MLNPVRWLLACFTPRCGIAPAIIAAGISAAGALASSKQAASASASATKQGRQFQLDMYRQQLVDQGKEYITRAKYAKKAGLHPLFALGTSPGFSPTLPSVGGGYGGAGADGIARAGEAIGQGFLNYKAEKKLDEIHALNVAKAKQELRAGELGIMKLQNDIQRAGQAANYLRGAGDGVNVYPMGVEAPRPQMRPLRVDPRVSAPKDSELVDEKGRKFKIYHEAAQADEINQVRLLLQELGYGAKDFVMSVPKKAYRGRRRRPGHKTSYGTVYGRRK